MDRKYRFESSYQIHEKEIDNVYRHAHHVFITALLERCRLDFLESIGLASHSLMAKDYFLVLTRLEMSFLRELRAGPVSVTCESPTVKGKEIMVSQQILNSKGKPAVRAEVELVFIRGSTRRAVNPPEEFLRRFGAL